MNSILQTLFMTPEFRSHIYEWNYEENQFWEEKDCIPFQLQKLFAKLQLKESSAASTQNLTTSFQWDSQDAFEQHDIQEFCRVLFDVIGETFRNSPLEGFIEKLFQGENKNFVSCLECKNESNRFEKWLDLQITVRDEFEKSYNDRLEKGLENYLKPERLEHDNQFYCEFCKKKTDADKGTSIIKTPPILSLILNRFTFDMSSLQRKKLDDFVSFPFILNMNNFLHGYEGIKKENYVSPTSNSILKGENNKSNAEMPKKKKVSKPAESKKGTKKTPAASSETKEFLKRLRAAQKSHNGDIANGDENLEYEKKSDSNSLTNPKDFRIVSNSPNKNFDSVVSPKEISEDSSNIKEEPKSSFKCPLEKYSYEEERRNLIESAFKEGEEVYDLYSVLVHSGGAFGGHYYSYTKSQDNGKWYHFNDRNVTEIDPMQIPGKTFGGSASTSAYMLFYRRVDKFKFEANQEYGSNVISIPLYLINKLEIEKAAEILKIEQEKVSRRITVRIYFQLTVKHVSISPFASYSDLLLEALKEYGLMEEIGNCRLRAYVPHTDIMLEDYCGKEEFQLIDLDITSFKTLCIEKKSEIEEFIPFIKDTVYFRLCTWEELSTIESENEKLLRKIQIHREAKTFELLSLIKDNLQLPNEQIAFYKKVESQCIAIIDLHSYSEMSVMDALIHEGTIIYIEVKKGVETSKWENYFEKKFYNFLIKFNDPRDEATEFSRTIQFDARKTLLELKESICQEINIPPSTVVMKRGGKNGIDIKDLAPTLQTMSFSSGSSVFLEMGMPCGVGEFRIIFYKAIRSYDNPQILHEYTYLFDLPIHGNSKPSSIIEKVKKEAEMRDIILQGEWRLREKLSDRLGRLYKEAPVKIQGIFDKRIMALEEIIQPCKYGERDLLLNVRIWDQSNWMLKPWFDIIVDKLKKLDEIANKIFEIDSAIPIEFMNACLILSLSSFKMFQLDKEEVDQLV